MDWYPTTAATTTTATDTIAAVRACVVIHFAVAGLFLTIRSASVGHFAITGVDTRRSSCGVCVLCTLTLVIRAYPVPYMIVHLRTFQPCCYYATSRVTQERTWLVYPPHCLRPQYTSVRLCHWTELAPSAGV